MAELKQRVLEHYVKIGRPLFIPKLQVRDGDEDADPIGVWSNLAEPKFGWEPTKEALRSEIIRLREMVGSLINEAR